MPKILITESGQSVHCEPGQSLLDILVRAGFAPPSPCGGTGACGKCLVTVLSGAAGAPSLQERGFFTPEQLASGLRLACMVFPEQDLGLSVQSERKSAAILSRGHLPSFPLQPAYRKEIESTPAGDVTAVYEMGRLTTREKGDSSKRLYGLAVDIGTTTVVVALADLLTGKELAAASIINPQKQFGFDVLSRLGFIMEEPKKRIPVVRKAIVDCLNALAGELISGAGVDAGDVWNITVAANTSMLHMFLGVDPSSLGLAPYTPVFTSAQRLLARQAMLHAAPEASLYCLPSVSAFIGADIVAGAIVAGLHEVADTVLFLDIGTNGEMILAHKGELIACSCAAGPALEGMNISCGMRAAAGAIEDVAATENGFSVQTIDDAAPVGICGSGILGAITALLKKGLVLPRGAIVKEETLADGDPRRKHLCRKEEKPAIRLTDGPEDDIFITQKDIRQVQLAKGALLSGILSLLDECGLAPRDIDRVLIAGQFGAHLPAASLTGCGIIPASLEGKIAYLGNTSKSGALAALLSLPKREEMEGLAARIRYLELSRLQGYDRLFASCLDFPHAPARGEIAGKLG
jgi:uncharacterized 2Fe-2S/4Fe-4S cluster protein (DUF4445 family)